MVSTAIVMNCSFLVLIWIFPVHINALYGNKTFSIGGIFDIYQSAKMDKVNPQTGIHFQEAYRFAISQINADKSVLYGFQLKEEIATTEVWKLLVISILNFFTASAPTAVGPYESLDAYRLSILTNGLGYPLVSYAADFELTDDSRHDFFFRTVPTDSFRVIAMIELLKKLKWDFVSVISSHAQNGDFMARNFVKKAALYDICYSAHTSLTNRPKKFDYTQALQIAAANQQASGLILFTTIRDTLSLLQELKELNLTNRFYVISATGLTNYVEVTHGNEALLEGWLSLESATVEIPKFKDHFLSLNPSKRKTSEFGLFWEQTFNCYLGKTSQKDKPNCTGKEKLQPGKGYYPNTPISQVIDSIYALALANKYIIEKSCVNQSYCDWDPSLSHYYVTDLQGYLRANSFADYTLKFTNPITSRNPYLVEYDILNYAKGRNGYENRKVGKWTMQRQGDVGGTSYLWGSETGSTQLNVSELRWGGQKKDVVSSCRQPCENGQMYSRNTVFNLKCCWACESCDDNEVVVNNTCRDCGTERKPDPEFKTCNRIASRYFQSQSTSFIAVRVYLGLSALGILSTIFVVIIFVKNNNNRIVRASGRDLCYFMLAGIAGTFVVPVLYFIKPNNVVCALTNVMPGITFCMCYAPLFLKTNRIYRIFQNAKTSISTPPLISPQSQLILIFGIIGVQVLLCVALLVGTKYDTVRHFLPESRDYIALYCEDEVLQMIIGLLLSFVFMVCCTWYAFKTRNFPKNYNESKYIGITMYITCICWAVFLPTYVISKQNGKYIRSHLMCIIAICVAFLNLIGLFGQKVKLLLFPRIADQNLSQNQQSQVSPEQNRLNGKVKIHKLDALSMCKEDSANEVMANEHAR